MLNYEFLTQGFFEFAETPFLNEAARCNFLFSEQDTSSPFISRKKEYYGSENYSVQAAFSILLHACIRTAASDLSNHDPFKFIKIRSNLNGESYSLEDLENYFLQNKRTIKLVAKRTKSGVSNNLSNEVDLGEALQFFRLMLTNLINHLGETEYLNNLMSFPERGVWGCFDDNGPSVFGKYTNTKLFNLLRLIIDADVFNIVSNGFTHYSKINDATFVYEAEHYNKPVYGRETTTTELNNAPALEYFCILLHSAILHETATLFYIYFNFLLGFGALYGGSKDKNRLTLNFQNHKALSLLGNYYIWGERCQVCDTHRVSGILPIIAQFLTSCNVVCYTGLNNLTVIKNLIHRLFATIKDTDIGSKKVLHDMHLNETISDLTGIYAEIFNTFGTARNFMYEKLYKDSELEGIVNKNGAQPLNNYFVDLLDLVSKRDLKVMETATRNKLLESMQSCVYTYNMANGDRSPFSNNRVGMNREEAFFIYLNRLFGLQAKGNTFDEALVRYFLIPVTEKSKAKDIGIGDEPPFKDLWERLSSESKDAYLKEDDTENLSPYDLKYLECTSFPIQPPGPRDFLALTSLPLDNVTITGITSFFISGGISSTRYNTYWGTRGIGKYVECGVRINDPKPKNT